MTSSGHFWGQGVISRAPASMSIQCPEVLVFKVLLQEVTTRRQHVSVSRSGWAASRALREAFLGGRGGWTGREDTAECLCSWLFPRTCPIPDPCQALADRSAEDAVVPRWGEGSVRGDSSGASTGVSAADQVTFPSSSSPERALSLDAGGFMEASGGAPGSRDGGPGHRRPDTPGLRGARLLARPPQLSQLAQSPGWGAPGRSGPRNVTKAWSLRSPCNILSFLFFLELICLFKLEYSSISGYISFECTRT